MNIYHTNQDQFRENPDEMTVGPRIVHAILTELNGRKGFDVPGDCDDEISDEMMTELYAVAEGEISAHYES